MFNTIVKFFKAKPKGKGVYTFTKAFLDTPEHFALSEKIDEVRAAGGDFMTLVRQLNQMCRTEVQVINNIVPTMGRENIINNMASATPTYSPLINKFVVGSGTTAPADGDVTLETETYRNDIASRTNAANVGYFTGFLNATEFSGTIREAGLVADGTGTVDTGALQSRVALNTVKGATETLTMDWTYTLL